MNILVLDDEREIADLVEVYLKNENYNVFKFYDAKEAINCIESQKLDFAILDVMVKDAWMEAAKEVNANGLGIKGNGMLSHISQMMVQRLNKQLKGEGDVDNLDILGNTTESAIQATKQALYNLDHPVVYTP